MTKIFLNGAYVNAHKAQVTVLDRGLLYGQGVFETMRAINGRVPYFKGHFKRLKDSARFVQIPLDISSAHLARVIVKLTRLNKLDDAYVRITITGGDNGPRGNIARGAYPGAKNVILFAHKFEPLPENDYEKGVCLDIARSRRFRASLLARHKTICYAENMLAKMSAAGNGCFDTLFLDDMGYVAECAVANVLWVAAGILKTPSRACPILPGVTRNAVIAIARKKGIEVWEQDRPRLSGMLGADEVFVTNSVVGVLPVVKIGMHRIGSGKPGKITAILRETYEKNLLRP